MTFEQFQKSRKLTADLCAFTSEDRNGEKIAGFIYADQFWIEIQNGYFWSQIGYFEFQSHDLTDVELWLFQSEVKFIMESNNANG